MNALQYAFDGDFQLLAVPSANFFNVYMHNLFINVVQNI